MEAAFAELIDLLKNEHTMSAYELHSSGLVQALFNALNVSVLIVILFVIQVVYHVVLKLIGTSHFHFYYRIMKNHARSRVAKTQWRE